MRKRNKREKPGKGTRKRQQEEEWRRETRKRCERKALGRGMRGRPQGGSQKIMWRVRGTETQIFALPIERPDTAHKRHIYFGRMSALRASN